MIGERERERERERVTSIYLTICIGMVKSMERERISVMDRGATATSASSVCSIPTIPFQVWPSFCSEPNSVSVAV